MFTVSRLMAIAAARALAGLMLSRARDREHRTTDRALRSPTPVAEPPAAELQTEFDVPPPAHPEGFTSGPEEVERAVEALRQALFPDRPYIVDLADWLEGLADWLETDTSRRPPGGDAQ